jgi:hypothetical protein
MSGLDLNAPPTEDFGMNDMEPQLCTQAASQEMVGKSPKPNIHDQGAVVGGYDEQWQGRVTIGHHTLQSTKAIPELHYT